MKKSSVLLAGSFAVILSASMAASAFAHAAGTGAAAPAAPAPKVDSSISERVKANKTYIDELNKGDQADPEKLKQLKAIATELQKHNEVGKESAFKKAFEANKKYIAELNKGDNADKAVLADAKRDAKAAQKTFEAVAKKQETLAREITEARKADSAVAPADEKPAPTPAADVQTTKNVTKTVAKKTGLPKTGDASSFVAIAGTAFAGLASAVAARAFKKN